MKINVDRASAGFAPEKNDKLEKIAQSKKPGANASAQTVVMTDELELTNTNNTVINAVREANIDSSSTEESVTDQLSAIRQKLSALNELIRENPLEALAAQANLNSETVARLVG